MKNILIVDDERDIVNVKIYLSDPTTNYMKLLMARL